MHDHVPTVRAGESLAEQAVHWHVRMTSGEVTPREHADFQTWFAEPVHARAYEEISQIWEAMGPALSAPDKVVPLAMGPARRRFEIGKFLNSWQGMAIAASVTFAVLGGYQYNQVWRFDHVTQGTERQTVALADGTQVTLNTGTALDVSYSGGVRRVRLSRGEAYFDVKHDPSHPFVVNAGNGDVTVLGTAFSVERKNDGAQVIVRRGKVRVRSGSDQVDITPGQMVTYAGGRESPVQAVDVGTALAWSEGRLVFENKPLGEVIDAIDRYYPGVILFTNKDKAARRVNAVVDLRRIDDWLNALKRSQGVAVRRLPAVTILS